jgi:hypothetical protein
MGALGVLGMRECWEVEMIVLADLL